VKNFMKYRLLILFSAAAVVLIAALFWPEPKKPGDMQKYYTQPTSQLLEMTYAGEMQKKDKELVQIDYTIFKEENALKAKEPLYRIAVKTANGARTFYGAPLIRTYIQDWSEPDYYYILDHEIARDEEYGVKGCPNKLTLKFKARTKNFCIGKPSQGDTRRYVLDIDADKMLIMPDFIARRIVGNIWAQREQALYPHGTEGVDLIDISIGKDILKKYPTLNEKTGGNFALRMLVKQEGKEKVNVWHIENILSIKPSHAQELSQYLTAMRVNSIFALDAAPQAQFAESPKAIGFSETTPVALTGKFKLKKTDKQDVLLSAFNLYAPGVRPASKLEFQNEGTAVKPLDTIAVSQYNSGYVTADNYPRLLAILTKFENDLTEAAKKGEQEKAERERKEKAQAQQPAPKKP